MGTMVTAQRGARSGANHFVRSFLVAQSAISMISRALRGFQSTQAVWQTRAYALANRGDRHCQGSRGGIQRCVCIVCMSMSLICVCIARLAHEAVRAPQNVSVCLRFTGGWTVGRFQAAAFTDTCNCHLSSLCLNGFRLYPRHREGKTAM